MNKQTLNINDYSIIVYLPKEEATNILYGFSDEEKIDNIWERIEDKNTVLANIYGIDWNHDFSPWKAKRVFKDQDDFGGGADELLKSLCEDIIPGVEKYLNLKPLKRGIVGYSLAGLFALYSVYNCDNFNRFASVSGSLWFDGLTDYIKENDVSKNIKRAYFSVGEKEKNTKNERMSKVEDVTKEIADIFTNKGIDAIFELNDGNHFTDIEQRILKGINFVLGD